MKISNQMVLLIPSRTNWRKGWEDARAHLDIAVKKRKILMLLLPMNSGCPLHEPSIY
jgi:hypothetical protein